MKRKPNPEKTNRENPTWRKEEFNRARPARDVLPKLFGDAAAKQMLGRTMAKLLLVTLLLIGCASVKITPEGQKVRVVRTTPEKCEYLGQVVGKPKGGIVNDLNSDGVDEMLTNSIKNNAAIMGANTVEVTNWGRLKVTGEAYRCENQKMPASAK